MSRGDALEPDRRERVHGVCGGKDDIARSEIGNAVFRVGLSGAQYNVDVPTEMPGEDGRACERLHDEHDNCKPDGVL
jgi:hypothetical protein